MTDSSSREFRLEPGWVNRARGVCDASSNLTNKYTHARLDPEDEGRYLRCLSIGGMALSIGTTPEAYLEMAERHFSVLESTGLSIPQREYYIEDTEEFDYPLSIMLYTSVPKIVGQRLSDIKEPQRHALASNLFSSLYNYYDWVRSKNEQLALVDISRLRQYHWGKIEDDENNRLYLHDLDPHLFNLTSEKDQELWELERREFKSLAKYVGVLMDNHPSES